MKQTDLMDLFEKASKSVCTSAVVVCPEPLPCTTQTVSALKTQKTQKRNLMYLKERIKEITKWNCHVIRSTAQV
jgi:hypothetical protein